VDFRPIFGSSFHLRPVELVNDPVMDTPNNNRSGIPRRRDQSKLPRRICNVAQLYHIRATKFLYLNSLPTLTIFFNTSIWTIDRTRRPASSPSLGGYVTRSTVYVLFTNMVISRTMTRENCGLSILSQTSSLYSTTCRAVAKEFRGIAFTSYLCPEISTTLKTSG